MQFDAGDDDGLLGGRDPRHRLLHRLGERVGIASRFGVGVGPDLVGHDAHDVAGQFQVDRSFLAVSRVEEEVDVAEGGGRIDDLAAGGADLFEHVQLRPPFPHPMVQQRVVDPFAETWRTRDQDHRALLGVGSRDRVGEAQGSHAIGHADGTHAVDPRIGIGGEARAVFAGAVDEVERAVLEHAVEGEHVVTRQAEDVADAIVGEPADQVLPDRQAGDTLRPRHRGPLVGNGHEAVVEARAEHDRHGSTPLFACPILKVGQPPLAGSQQREPEAQKRGHAGDHDQRTPRVVVEHPRASCVKQSPDNDRHHDPGEDPFGTRRRFGSGHISKDTPAGRRDTTGPEKTKAPGTVQIPGGRGS